MFRFQNREGFQNNENSNRSSNGPFQPGKPFEKRKCLECGSEEHLIAKCPNKQSVEKGDSSLKKKKDKQANGLIHSPTKVDRSYAIINIPVETKMKDGNEMLFLTNGLIISEGKVASKVVKVLRDTGCTTIFVSEELSKNGKRTGHFQTVTLANGRSCECEEVLIHIETNYISGQIKGLIMNNPFADLVIGNVGYVQCSKNGEHFQAVETRTMKDKRENEETMQKVIEDEILQEKELTSRERINTGKDDNRDKRIDTSDSTEINQIIDLSISRNQLKEEQEADESLRNVRKYAVHQSNGESLVNERTNSYFL